MLVKGYLLIPIYCGPRLYDVKLICNRLDESNSTISLYDFALSAKLTLGASKTALNITFPFSLFLLVKFTANYVDPGCSMTKPKDSLTLIMIISGFTQ